MSTQPTSSKLERLERAFERALLLNSSRRPYSPRTWALGTILFGILNAAISLPPLLFAEGDLPALLRVLHVGALAFGLMLVCQGAGELLRARSGTVARLLRVGAVLAFGPVVLVCCVALLVGLLGPVLRALLWAAGVLALALLIYGAIRLLLPPRWQARFFGEDYTRQR